MALDADIIVRTERARKIVTASHSRSLRANTGQFLTPASISTYMSSIFGNAQSSVRILDAGAGTGSLFTALVFELVQRRTYPKSIIVHAFETDESLRPYLEESISLCRNICHEKGIHFDGVLFQMDFIASALHQLDAGLFDNTATGYTHAILNPPYKKINSDSATRKRLNAFGFETSNLYSAFVWLSIHLLNPGGEIVAITPRSFCNGPYFKRYRKALLQLVSLERIHTFQSRKEAFADDSVLQENIIFHGIRGKNQSKTVDISSSVGADLSKTSVKGISFDSVVLPGDKDSYIHIVEDDAGLDVMDWMSAMRATLPQLGLEVSTGRVVDFRSRGHIRRNPEKGTVPLIYPVHFKDGFVVWPSENDKKPNAIAANNETENLLVKSSYYVLTKRFSSKEERRRVVAVVFNPNTVDAEYVGFENHLNFFHSQGNGLEPALAVGLACYLNSSVFDQYFRLFSGHTQVNAGDLRKVMYPLKAQLMEIGTRAGNSMLDQKSLDVLVEEVCGGKGS